MMKAWNHRFVALGLVVALTMGAGCTSSESPMGQSADRTADAPELLLGGLVPNVLSITDLLTCSSLPYATTARTIGPNGGVVSVGQYTLVIPAGALSSNVEIRAEQMSGKVNSVRFSPEGQVRAPGCAYDGIPELRGGAPAQAHRLYDRPAQGAERSSVGGLARLEDRHCADRPLLAVRRGVLKI
jgi:hypothetical protein